MLALETLRQDRERCPQVQARIEGETVSVSGPLAADVEFIADGLIHIIKHLQKIDKNENK
jgi:hypothetical protein